MFEIFVTSPLKRGKEIFGNFTPKLPDDVCDCELRFKSEFEGPCSLVCCCWLLDVPPVDGVEVTGAVEA